MIPAITNTELIEQLNTRGFAVIPNVISPAEADVARVALEALIAAEQQPRHVAARTQRVAEIALKHQIFRDLMCHPTIVSLWRDWLGQDTVCSTWTGNTTFAGFETLAWHADFPYWSMQAPWPAGNLCGQTIWMLDDFTVENGGTGVVPHSHHKLHGPDNSARWREDAEIITGTRGSVAVLHGALWHTSRANGSTRSRSALLGMYTRPSIVTQEDMRAQLERLTNPTPLEQQLMGANAYRPATVPT